MIQLTLTLKMTTAQAVKTSVTVLFGTTDDQTQPTFEMTPGFKPFIKLLILIDLEAAWLSSWSAGLVILKASSSSPTLTASWICSWQS